MLSDNTANMTFRDGQIRLNMIDTDTAPGGAQ
jgi:hypothetical protein